MPRATRLTPLLLQQSLLLQAPTYLMGGLRPLPLQAAGPLQVRALRALALRRQPLCQPQGVRIKAPPRAAEGASCRCSVPYSEPLKRIWVTP